MSPPEGELIQKECEMGNAYKIYIGGLTPKLSIESETEDKDNGLFQVDITVRNEGFLPTALQHAQQIGAAKPLVLEVEPDGNLEIILGEDMLALGHIFGNSKSEKTTYIVRKKDSSRRAALTAVVASPKAGKATETIVVQ